MSFAALVLAVVMLEVDVRYGHVPWSWAAVLRIDAAGQMLDYNGLALLAAEHNCYVEVEKRAGNYMIEHATIGCCYAAGRAPDA